MPRLPAFCESCGAVFASPLRAAAPGEENAFEIPVPCPVCGGSGRVPGELLGICVEAARLFREADPADGDAFLEVLAAPPEGDAEPGEELVAETARRAPAFVELARRLPAGRPSVVRAVEGLLRRVRDELPDGDGPDRGADRGDAPAGAGAVDEAAALRAVSRLLEEEAVEAASEEVPDRVAAARRRLGSAGRNDPCPCGSGDKYKNCHWVADLRTTRG